MKNIFKKSDLAKFFDDLKKEYELIGPTRKNGVLTFDRINVPEDLVLDKQTDYSPKKFFLPPKEAIMGYDKKGIISNISKEKRAIIMHPCDANSLLITDRLFLDEMPDPYYEARRKNTLLVVFKCLKPDKNCFCTSMNTSETTNYDLYFIDVGDKYIVSVNSDKGRAITSKSKLFSPVLREGFIKVNCEKKLFEPTKLDSKFPDSVWKEGSDKCLYCNACTIACPNCMCFDIKDVPDLSGESGSRIREWDSCKRPDFTEVAGGFVFRDEKLHRFKHRIYHKLKYYRDRHGRNMCVGCGRCITVCPAGIDFVDIVNKIRTE